MKTSNVKIFELPSTRMHKEELITMGDLHEFKSQLLAEIKSLLSESGGQSKIKKWLKSYQVQKLLNISRGTLQTLRANGSMPFTKVGGVIYFDYDDIEAMLKARKSS